VLVFAGFQVGDDRIMARASDFYRASQLPNIELPRYAQYLLEQQRGDDARRFARVAKDVHLQEFADALMEDDEMFMRELRADVSSAPRCRSTRRGGASVLAWTK